MPSHPSVVVDVCRPAPDRLPDELVESALRLGDLQRRGFSEQVGERLRLRRKAGSYVGIDLVAFLIAYHASGLMCGVKEFVDRFRGHGPRLAALAGRRRQPATSSISRLARSVKGLWCTAALVHCPSRPAFSGGGRLHLRFADRHSPAVGAATNSSSAPL